MRTSVPKIRVKAGSALVRRRVFGARQAGPLGSGSLNLDVKGQEWVVCRAKSPSSPEQRADRAGRTRCGSPARAPM